MPPARDRLVFPPTTAPTGQSFHIFSGYKSYSPVDRLMRLRELPHMADDVASLRARGFVVVFDFLATRAKLEAALLGADRDTGGAVCRGVLWNGHGADDGSIEAHDGTRIAPEALSRDVAARDACALFVLACCHAGGHAARWSQALGPSAHVFGWPMPVTVEKGIDFYTPDAASKDDLDDLLLTHLGVPPLGGTPPEETRALLQLDAEHAAYFQTNPYPVASLSENAHCLAQWKNGTWYGARITAFDGLRYLATWDDGDTPTWVQPYQLRPDGAPTAMEIPGRLTFGSKVTATWRNGQRYPGVLADWNGTHWLVAWDDGDAPSWAPPHDVAPRAEPLPPVGAKVVARWTDGRFYAGAVAEVDAARGGVRVVWDDGSPPLWVAAADVRPQ